MVKPGNPGPEFSQDREIKVILEDIQSQFRVFGEGMEDVRSRLGKIETNVAEVKIDIHMIKSSMDRFFSQLSDHETRLTTLEKR